MSRNKIKGSDIVFNTEDDIFYEDNLDDFDDLSDNALFDSYDDEDDDEDDSELFDDELSED